VGEALSVTQKRIVLNHTDFFKLASKFPRQQLWASDGKWSRESTRLEIGRDYKPSPQRRIIAFFGKLT
jgi:hypothetical protein